MTRVIMSAGHAGGTIRTPWARAVMCYESFMSYIYTYMGGGRGARISVPPIGSDLDAPTAVVRYSMHVAGSIQGLDLRSAGDGGGGGATMRIQRRRALLRRHVKGGGLETRTYP